MRNEPVSSGPPDLSAWHGALDPALQALQTRQPVPPDADNPPVHDPGGATHQMLRDIQARHRYPAAGAHPVNPVMAPDPANPVPPWIFSGHAPPYLASAAPVRDAEPKLAVAQELVQAMEKQPDKEWWDSTDLQAKMPVFVDLEKLQRHMYDAAKRYPHVTRNPENWQQIGLTWGRKVKTARLLPFDHEVFKSLWQKEQQMPELVKQHGPVRKVRDSLKILVGAGMVLKSACPANRPVYSINMRHQDSKAIAEELRREARKRAAALFARAGPAVSAQAKRKEPWACETAQATGKRQAATTARPPWRLPALAPGVHGVSGLGGLGGTGGMSGFWRQTDGEGLSAALRNLFQKDWTLPPAPPGQGDELSRACRTVDPDTGEVRDVVAPDGYVMKPLMLDAVHARALADQAHTLPGLVLYEEAAGAGAAGNRDRKNVVTLVPFKGQWYSMAPLNLGPEPIDIAAYFRNLPHDLHAVVPGSPATTESPFWQFVTRFYKNQQFMGLTEVLDDITGDSTSEAVAEWLIGRQAGGAGAFQAAEALQDPAVVQALLNQQFGVDPYLRVVLPTFAPPAAALNRAQLENHALEGARVAVAQFERDLNAMPRSPKLLCLPAAPFYLRAFDQDGDWYALTRAAPELAASWTIDQEAGLARRPLKDALLDYFRQFHLRWHESANRPDSQASLDGIRREAGTMAYLQFQPGDE